MPDVTTACNQLEAAAALDCEGRIKEALPLYVSSIDRLMLLMKSKTASSEQLDHMRSLVLKYLGRAEELKKILGAAPQLAGASEGHILRAAYSGAGPAERSLLLLRDGLAPLVQTEMERSARAGWPPGSSASELDPYRLLAVLWQNWCDVFQNSASFPAASDDGGWTRTLVAEVRHWRNVHAHQGHTSQRSGVRGGQQRPVALNAEDSWRLVDSCQRLLGCAAPSAKPFAHEIRRMKPGMLGAIKDEMASVEMGL